MTNRQLRGFSCALTFWLGVACGDAEDPAPRLPASTAGGPAPAAVSGGQVAGAAPQTARAESRAATAGDYTVAMCPDATPRALSEERIPCDGAIRCGGAASCRATDSTDAMRAPDCSTGKCVPDVVAMAGRVRFQPCQGTGGQGVCVPLCFALVRNPLSSAFPKGEAGCGKEEICAPCRNPLDGTPTGACGDTCVQ